MSSILLIRSKRPTTSGPPVGWFLNRVGVVSKGKLEKQFFAFYTE